MEESLSIIPIDYWFLILIFLLGVLILCRSSK